MGRFANLSFGTKAVAVGVTIAAAGTGTGFTLAAASSSNANGNSGSSNGAPAQPVIGSSGLPVSPTNATTASFTYTDSRNSVNFMCSLDTAPFSTCPSSGMSYTNLGNVTHTFRVEAQSGKGNGPVSSPATFTWTVANQTFPISGSLTAPLGPGIPAQILNLSITNPYSFTMKVTAINVTVASTGNITKCPVPGNFATTNYSGPGFTVPAGITETMTTAHVLSTQLPTVQMVDLPKNQDGCKGVNVNLSYTGSVTTP